MFIGLKSSNLLAQFSETHLILSIGSFGNHAMDILHVNNKLQKIGYLKSDTIQPLIQNNKEIQGSQLNAITLPAEFYQTPEHTFLQIRSTVKKGYKKQFLNEITNFLLNSKFKSVIILGAESMDDAPEKFIMSNERSAFYFQNSLFEQELLSQFNTKNLTNAKELQLEEGGQKASGIGAYLYKKNLNIPFCVLYLFTRPGIDIQGSQLLAEQLVYFLKSSHLKEISANNSYKIPQCFLTF